MFPAKRLISVQLVTEAMKISSGRVSIEVKVSLCVREIGDGGYGDDRGG